MKKINEKLNPLNISEFINSNLQEKQFVDEGLGDAFKAAKSFFGKTIKYLKNVVAKVGKMFVAIGNDGKVIPAVLPVNIGVAYKENIIDHSTTGIVLNAEDNKVVSAGSNFDNVVDSISYYDQFKDMVAYWKSLVKNSKKNENLNFNSNKFLNEAKLETSDPQAKYAVVSSPEMLIKHIKVGIGNTGIKPLLIFGAPGIGKTAIVESVVKSIKAINPEYRLIVKVLQNETPDNFTLPVQIFGKDGKSVEAVTDVPKNWIPVYLPTDDEEENKRRDEACGSGILFFDELARASEKVRNVILTLLNERKFNDYKLGSGWIIVAASNRPEDEEGNNGQTEMGVALLNKFRKVYYEPTFESWKTWAENQKYISPLILQWLGMPESSEFGGSKFYYFDPNEEGNEDGNTSVFMCTPRSWDDACRTLAAFADTADLSGHKLLDIPEEILTMGLGGILPKEVIDKFLSFIKVIQSAGDIDTIIDAAWNGGHVIKINDKALAKISIPIAQMVVGDHSSEKLPTEEEWSNLCDWLVAQESDQLASYVLDLVQNVWFGDLMKTMKGYAEAALQWSRYKAAKEKLINAGDKEAKSEFARVTKALDKQLSKYDITSKEMPDYYPALKRVAAKYGKVFKSAIVNGKEALG